MKRGLIIGASHAAALRLAWSQWGADWPGMALEFAALQGSVGDLMVDGGQLVPRDDGARERLLTISGRESFTLADYGFVAVCGGVSGSFSGIRLYNQARCFALPSIAAGKIPQGANWTLLSTACFTAALTGLIGEGAAPPLLRAIRATVDVPLFAVAEPMLSITALIDKTRFHGFRALQRNGDAEALAALLETASRAAYDGLAQYMAPPAEVRHLGYFTRPDLRRGATRLGPSDDVAQPETDFLHGNAEYGRHILSALHLAVLRA